MAWPRGDQPRQEGSNSLARREDRVPRLIVTKGADEGRQFDLAEPVIGIGRDKTNPIHLHDTEVSRRHLELHRLDNGHYRLLDVGSANGTLVNRQPIRDALLKPGDHIQVGQSILVYAGNRTEAPTPSLADQIRLITQQDRDVSSAIIKTIGENDGSRLLAQPDRAATDWLKSRLLNLGVIYQTIQAVSQILDIDPMLDRIMELIFDSIEADHGCIMLRDADSQQFVPKAVRYREGSNRQEKIAISRTIMEHVLQEKQGVLVSDAAKDDRFNAGHSIARFNMHEVICVPMKGRHEIVGVLFLDTKSNLRELMDRGVAKPTGKFSPDHLTLAGAIAHQAALAVEETRYHQALIQAEQLAAVGQTIAALSHHIKNIMQGVVFGSDLVNKGLDENELDLVRKGWQMVQRNQSKIHALVMDMLSYSKEREPSIEAVELNPLIEEVLEVVHGRAQEKQIRLEFYPSAKIRQVPADREGIHRALLNIVSNALDAVDDRPNAQVAVQTLLESGGDWVRVIVLDNGVGIPVEQRETIFKPFFSSKGARGTGLGLAVSRKIFREHGGDITVHSEMNKGSKFILRLPMRSPHSVDSLGTVELPPLPPEDTEG